MNKNSCPARVFALIPESNDDAIIVRRGPAERVGIFRWNIKTDQVEGYQWLKGRIYEYFCDISPNGKYLIYSANKKGWGYTVISRCPWIKAISYWTNGGFYGGGIFLDDNKYLLYDITDYTNKLLSKELFSSEHDANLLRYGVYPARLLRRGWQVKSHDEHGITFAKTIYNLTSLEKYWKNWPFGAEKKGKGAFWEYHKLVRGANSVDKYDWEWCEWLNGNLVWVENGCLYRSPFIHDDLTVDAQLIYDFNLATFKEKTAPY